MEGASLYIIKLYFILASYGRLLANKDLTGPFGPGFQVQKISDGIQYCYQLLVT